MLSVDPAAVRAGARTICLVAGDGWNPETGGFTLAGGKVHVLHCGRHDPPSRLTSGGVGFSRLKDFEVPALGGVANVHGRGPSDRSDLVRHALARLHREHHFDAIVFPALGGLGFRSIQAQRAGVAFPGVLFAVRLDSCRSWQRLRDRQWPAGPEDLEGDFIERYSFEHAQVQITPAQEVLEHVRRIGWRVRREDSTPGPRLPQPCESGRVGPGWATTNTADTAAARGTPLVSVCIPYYNLGRYLPETLASLAEQTWPHLEVTVIDDGSTDPASVRVFEEMRARHPDFRFVRQDNCGIGATRNRGLREARGEYFLPIDADNIARPDMVERFVAAIHSRPDLGAVSSWFLAFRETPDIEQGRFAYAYRPTGGPHVLASMRNVYGDANALYRTKAFRAVGGYETDRDTSWEDWEAFVKLVNAGWRIDVVPEYLFYYRHLESGFSRTTSGYANHKRVLRQFTRLPRGEEAILWEALVGFQRRIEQLGARERRLRDRVADRLRSALRGLKWLLALVDWPERP
jgi:glycosyltransferase involved in cell wall biosynthesis